MKIFRRAADTAPRRLPPWLLEAIKRAPAVADLARRAQEAWDRVTDPGCPRWSAAVALVGVLECIPIVVTGPVVVAIRLAVIKGFLDSRDRSRKKEKDKQRKRWRG